jgi:hypothetical protein
VPIDLWDVDQSENAFLRHERCRNPVPMLRALCHERAALTAKF